MDRPHRLRHPRAAPGQGHEESRRPAALGRRPPNASAATACAGKTKTELYNNGGAFKLTCRDESGVIVTIIADNYFGYCKKEVKTQISYAANLFGICEEEHAGGALVFPAYDLGEEFSGEVHVKQLGHTFRGSQLDVSAT